MKKAVSALLAFVMLISVLCSGYVNAYAKTTAEAKLKSIQTISGFVPGQTSIVTGNCYAFVSKVCEKLYGVGYQEGLYGNYKTQQYSGNYYRVAMFETQTTVPDTALAKKIKAFFVNNAQPGDIIHYGAYTTGSGNGSTHTFMVNHIDSNKMTIYHANYGVGGYAATDCHIDTIYWDSFVSNPTKTIYNSDGTVYSLNSIFYNKMKVSGLGITINRYKKYTDLYSYVNTSAVSSDATPAKVTGLKLTGKTETSLSLSWDDISNAASYYIYVKNNTKKTTFNKTVYTNSAKLSGLTDGNSYTIKVKAINAKSVGGSYSSTITATTGVDKVGMVTGLALSGATTTTLSLKWDKLDNTAKYNIYIVNNTKNTNFSKTSTTNSATITGLTKGNSYTIKVRGVSSLGTTGSYSSTITAKTTTGTAKVTGLKVSTRATTSIKYTWTKVSTATKYYMAITNNTNGNTYNKTVTTNSATISNLTPGNIYSVKVKAYSADGWGSYSSVVKSPSKPKTVSISSASSAATKIITAKWGKVSGSATGYQIYYSTDKSFSSNVTKQTVKGQSTVSYKKSGFTKGKTYYVKVRAYKTVSSTNYYGAFSSVKTVKCS